MIDGDFAFVAETTGYDYATMSMPADVTSQSRNCFKTIEAALKEGGFEMPTSSRVTYYLTDAKMQTPISRSAAKSSARFARPQRFSSSRRCTSPR